MRRPVITDGSGYRERIILRRPRWLQEISLDAIPIGTGFHRVEHDGMRSWRWTDGSAHLTLPAGVVNDGNLLLDLHVVAAQDAWVRVNAAKSANRVSRKPNPSIWVAQTEPFADVA